jgi:hypothetical protein
MIKKDITFDNLDGESITRSFWFNLNKAELAKLQLEHEGGYEGYVQEALKAEDTKKIIALFDELLSKAYGIRDQDGVTFRKNPEYWAAFMESDAYSELFVDLLTHPKETGIFFAGIVPRDFQKDVSVAMAKSMAKVETVENIFDAAKEDTGDETGEPTHELPQPALTGAIEPKQNNAADLLAGMSEEDKQAMREALNL